MNAVLLVCLLLSIAMGSSVQEPTRGDREANSASFSVGEVIERVSHHSLPPVPANWMRYESSLAMLLEEFMIDTSITYVGAPYPQWYPSVAFDGTNYLVVWEDERNGSDCHIYGARVDQSGTVLDSLGIAISKDAYGQRSPSVAFDGTNYLVVWEDFRSAYDCDIYGARVDTSGTVLDSSGIAISTAANWQMRPSVVFDGTNYFVVWDDERSGSDRDIYGARVDQSGTTLDSSGIAVCTATDWQACPSIAFDDTNYFVVWYDHRSGADSDVYGARVTQSGTVLDSSGIAISTAADWQRYPSVAFDGTNYLVVWEDERSGSDSDIYGARVDQGGTVLDPSGIAISSAVYWQERPSVSFDGANYLAVWGDGRGSSYDIYGARINQSGTVLDPLGIAISAASRPQWSPSVAFDGMNYLVVWVDGRSSSYDIYGARVGQSGTVLDPSGIAISTAAHGQAYASLAWDGTDYFVVWEDERNGSDSDIYGARIDQSGTVLDPLGIAISAASYSQRSPSVAFDGTNYLVAWGDERSSLGSDIYGARVTQSGTVLEPSGIAISTAAGWQGFPSVAFDGTNYLAVWADWRSGSDCDIYGARMEQAGTVLDPSGIPISTAADWQEYPSVAFDGTNYLVVWGDERSGSDGDIYGARVTQSGTVLEPSGIAISVASDRQAYPSVAFDGTNYIVVWEDWRNGFADIYGARVTQSGTVLEPSGIAICSALDWQGFPSVAYDGTNYLVVWEDWRNGSDYDIYGARVDTAGTVLDPSGIELINQPYNRRYPAVAGGSFGQSLLVYQGFVTEPYATQRIFGAYYPSVGAEEKAGPESQAEVRGSLNIYPNPVRTLAIIEFFLPKTETVRLCLYNTAGQLTKTILNSELSSGRHRIETSTSELPSGIYFWRLVAGDFAQTRKIVLMK